MGRIFESKDAVLKAIREEVEGMAEAVEGNTPSTITGNEASHPVGHIGVYPDSSKKEGSFAGTIFSQRCLDENGKEKVVWTTNINSRKETTQGRVAVSAKPVITDLHSTLIPSEANLVSQVIRAFPKAQPGNEFFITTSPEIVETYLNPVAFPKDSWRARKPTISSRAYVPCCGVGNLRCGVVSSYHGSNGTGRNSSSSSKSSSGNRGGWGRIVGHGHNAGSQDA